MVNMMLLIIQLGIFFFWNVVESKLKHFPSSLTENHTWSLNLVHRGKIFIIWIASDIFFMDRIDQFIGTLFRWTYGSYYSGEEMGIFTGLCRHVEPLQEWSMSESLQEAVSKKKLECGFFFMVINEIKTESTMITRKTLSELHLPPIQMHVAVTNSKALTTLVTAHISLSMYCYCF